MPSLEDLTPDQLLEHAKKTEESHALVTTLLSSPDTRETTLRLIKKANPKQTIPEIETKDAVEAAVTKVREENDARWNKHQEEQINARIAKHREEVKSQYNLTEAELLEVEKIMIDKDAPIPHYAAAAKVYRAQQKVAEPTPASLSAPVFDMPDKETWKGGIGNTRELNNIAMREAYKAANEVGLGRKQ